MACDDNSDQETKTKLNNHENTFEFKSPMKNTDADTVKSSPLKTPKATPQKRTPPKVNNENKFVKSPTPTKDIRQSSEPDDTEKNQNDENSDTEAKNEKWREFKLLSPSKKNIQSPIDIDSTRIVRKVTYGFKEELLYNIHLSPIDSINDNRHDIGFEKIPKDYPDIPKMNLDSPRKLNRTYYETGKSSTSSSPWKILICILVVLIAMYFGYVKLTSPQQTQTPVQTDKQKLDTLKTNLKHNFPNQSNNFLLNLLSSYDHSIIKSKDPSIILLISDKKSGRNLKCVSERILSVMDTESSLKTSIISPADVMANDAETVKFNLDLSLEEVYKNKRIALLENIERLPPASMILFYTYGDDAHTAKYSGIILMFTLELDLNLTDKDHEMYTKNVSKFSEFIENYLKSLWRAHIDFDQLLPLLARIANNLILLNNESFCV